MAQHSRSTDQQDVQRHEHVIQNGLESPEGAMIGYPHESESSVYVPGETAFLMPQQRSEMPASVIEEAHVPPSHITGCEPQYSMNDGQSINFMNRLFLDLDQPDTNIIYHDPDVTTSHLSHVIMSSEDPPINLPLPGQPMTSLVPPELMKTAFNNEISTLNSPSCVTPSDHRENARTAANYDVEMETAAPAPDRHLDYGCDRVKELPVDVSMEPQPWTNNAHRLPKIKWVRPVFERPDPVIYNDPRIKWIEQDGRKWQGWVCSWKTHRPRKFTVRRYEQIADQYNEALAWVNSQEKFMKQVHEYCQEVERLQLPFNVDEFFHPTVYANDMPSNESFLDVEGDIQQHDTDTLPGVINPDGFAFQDYSQPEGVFVSSENNEYAYQDAYNQGYPHR